MARYLALVPAAGHGARMAESMPKQYIPLLGKPMLYHSLKRLCEHPDIARVFVVLAPDDTWFARYDWQEFSEKLAPYYCGGETRAASVLNGLMAAQSEINPADWVLVHDAARPCLGRAELDRLIAELSEDRTGGLLAVPVTDTLKRGDGAHRVMQTERRENLWQAQTPQMFRYRLLVEALQTLNGASATDEARAVENLGHHPKLVEGDVRNLKVTYPRDIALAELILRDMEKC